ncbi:MAG TPA: hypothetical protein VFS81_07355, partial [Candidatus Binatia bacterium]|nr:hypothetical protein [Candidatus Binatia bacterium]
LRQIVLISGPIEMMRIRVDDGKIHELTSTLSVFKTLKSFKTIGRALRQLELSDIERLNC